MSDDVLERLGSLLNLYPGCSNHGCLYRSRGGVKTNAICQCSAVRPWNTEAERIRGYALNMKNLAEDMASRIESLQAEVERLRRPVCEWREENVWYVTGCGIKSCAYETPRGPFCFNCGGKVEVMG